MSRGAIILCGGKSSRMGRDKALLPFGDETLLARCVRILSDVVPTDQVLCVAAEGQTLPPLPEGVRVVRDSEIYEGPLAGLVRGLRELSGNVDALFVVGCDSPLLLPAFVERLFESLGEHAIAAVHDGARFHPLGAVYRPSVLPKAESLLAAGERRLVALVEACDTCRVPLERVRDVDPELQSVVSCNTVVEYEQALGRAFPAG